MKNGNVAHWVRLLGIALTISLAACGGGGGGDAAVPSMSLSTHAVSQIAATNGPAPASTLQISVSTPLPSTGGIGYQTSNNGISSISFNADNDTTATVTISFKAPSLLGPGTYSDQLTLAACLDSQCSKQALNSPQIVNVQYVVAGTATASLSADPLTVGVGQSTTLTWSSTQAQSCTASGEWSGTLATSGSKVVTPGSLGSHTYTLNCSNPGAPVQALASVTVTVVAPVASLSAFPLNVVAGKTVTLRWQGQYASSCTASGAWSGSLAPTGFQTLTLNNQGTEDFHLVCSNSTGSTSATDATVTVGQAPAFPPATAYRMTEAHDGVIITTDGATYPAKSAPTWTANFGAPISYPLIANGMVFVATANPDQSYGNRLYGLNAQTGATIWGPVAVPGVYFGSGITYDNGRVFILMFDGGVRAFNASNGAALWSAQLPGYWYDGSPNAYGGIVFIFGNAGISALDETSGTILWTTTSITSSGWVSPAVSSEGAYVQDGYGCMAGAYEPVKGAAIWENTSQQCNTPWGYTPVIAGGTFYGRTTGSLNLFDAETGKSKGQLGAAFGPSITKTAVIALNAGTLSATRLSDLAPTWTFTGDGNLITAPVVVNNTVFVGSSSGKVYGLDAGTGAQTWLGISPQPINQDSENGGPMPPSGPAAGENLLIFPAGNSLVAWQFH